MPSTAMTKGDFYSSSGVMLSKLYRGKSSIELEVDVQSTARELGSEFLFGRLVKNGEPETFVEFIGPGGEIVQSTSGNQASCKIRGAYLRGKVTHCVKKEDLLPREYYAWTQPIFADNSRADASCPKEACHDHGDRIANLFRVSIPTKEIELQAIRSQGAVGRT